MECFLVSGFDDVDAIVEMNTDDDGPKSSISLIENFIDKRKAELPKCVGPNQILNIPFELPPGHRIRIQKFVKEVKGRYGVLKKHKAEKLPNVNAKRQKLEIEKDDNEDNGDISSTTDEIRRKVISWSKRNCAGSLKENEHFSIHVTRNTGSTKLSVSIRCHCGKALLLQRKPNGSKPWQLSNWTKHFKQCKYGKGPGKQDTLQSFFPVALGSKKTWNQSPLASKIPPTSLQSLTQTTPVSTYPAVDVSSSQNMPKHFFSPYVNIPSFSLDPSWQMSSSIPDPIGLFPNNTLQPPLLPDQLSNITSYSNFPNNFPLNYGQFHTIPGLSLPSFLHFK